MSKEYKQLPSEIYHVEDELAAFFFDRAVSTFGQTVDADIAKSIEGKTGAGAQMAASITLKKWIDQAPTKYADPANARRLSR